MIIQVELISIQAIKVITVARVISDIVWVVLSYNRPDGLWTFFETTGVIGTIWTIIWKPEPLREPGIFFQKRKKDAQSSEVLVMWVLLFAQSIMGDGNNKMNNQSLICISLNNGIVLCFQT